MTTIRTKATPEAVKAVPKNPPVGGGSTVQMMKAFTVGLVDLADRKQLSGSKHPLVAKVVLQDASFADLRNAVHHLENAPLARMQSIDESMALMASSKEAKKLDVSIAPLRIEVNERIETQKAFAATIEAQYPEYKNALIQLLKDILQGNTKPSHIDPTFSTLQRSTVEKQKELESLKRNNDYLLVKMQPVESRVNFQVVAFKSEMVMQGERSAPQLG